MKFPLRYCSGDPVDLTSSGEVNPPCGNDFCKIIVTPDSRRTEYRTVEVQEWIDNDDSMPEL